ncbi:MAG: hypothetical protein PUC44_04200, partial [Eubacteriales bacterium]|nr:hypothetical protein [Eubacteriales bacterium]
MNGKHERRKNSRSAGRGKTLDLKKAHYSTDLIREYEDPEFAEEAYRYEQEKRKKQGETYRDFQGRSRKPHPDRRREPGGFEQAYEEKRARQEEYNRSLYNDAGGFG